MDSLAPPLEALLYIKLKIQTGASTRESIKDYIYTHPNCLFAKNLDLWLFEVESLQSISYKNMNNPYRRLFIELLKRGLEGEPILKLLHHLEMDMIEACKEDIQKQIQKLPFITLIPLLFLQVPAFLVLVIGPLMSHLLQAIP